MLTQTSPLSCFQSQKSRRHVLQSRARTSLLLIFAVSLIIAGCGAQDTEVSPEAIKFNDRGVAKMGQFQYAAAYDDFTRVTELEPRWEVGLVNLAIATLNRQNPDDELLTLETLEKVLALNPTNVRAQYTSGIVNLYLGNTAEAIEFLTTSVNLDPNDAFGTYFLGQAHLQAGQYEQAQQWLLKTLELNAAIRSAYWAAATASRRLGEIDRATELIEDYQEFEHNPLSISAGFSYKQMGPKAEAQSVIKNTVLTQAKPAGPLFVEPRVITENAQGIFSVSSHDLNGDGHWDLLLSNKENTQIWMGGERGFESLKLQAAIPAHLASAWGDLDNDGPVELITCGLEGLTTFNVDFNQAMVSPRQKIDETSCTSLRVVDIDHDGALDIIASGSLGSSTWRNNRNGGFQLNEALRIGSPIRQVLLEDFDRDRDVDLIFVGLGSPNVALRNELTWRYAAFPDLNQLEQESFLAATSFDINLDGRVELVAATRRGSLDVWESHAAAWHRDSLDIAFDSILSLDGQDFDGDGKIDLFIAHEAGFTVIDPRSMAELSDIKIPNLRQALPIFGSPNEGWGVLAITDQNMTYYAPGIGRYPLLAVLPSGKSSADQMRSNASGIGVYAKLRTDTRWSLASNFASHSGSSQSLQPLVFGSGGAAQADYIELLWSDGVTQSERNLAFGQVHRIDEIQRQLASCPVVFVWNGYKYEFVSDVLGVAALGYFAEPDTTTPVRPNERLLLPEGLLKARNGKFEVKIGEPMEEVLYLDSASLLYVDVPQVLDMVIDERLSIQSVEPTGEPIYFSEVYTPVNAHSGDNPDVLEELLKADRYAVDPGAVDKRFIGLTSKPHTLTMEFADELPTEHIVMVIDGWVEFPYSQTSFSAFSTNTSYRAPTLEARDGNGDWQIVMQQFGFPAGMPRQMALPLPMLPDGTTALRLTSNLEVYWDRIRIVRQETAADFPIHSTSLVRAVVRAPGYAKRTTKSQRVPYYDYDERSPYWDAKFANGFYTAMGPATELVETVDSAVAIIGSGEEVHLEFTVPPTLKDGLRRFYILDFHGWAKDMDMYTSTGDTVQPIPQLSDTTPAELTRRKELHEKYNVRYQSGLARP
ncbi:MAG: tetratricopeptide repeat protein [Gammaproteobacteria bacterium]|nr:tetratricopeptide repeat protein [Gammaproteobacteria bacterium]